MAITAQQALQRTIEHREIFYDEMLSLMRQIMAGEVEGRVPVERQQRPIEMGRRASVSWWIAGLILLGLLFWVGTRWARSPEG